MSKQKISFSRKEIILLALMAAVNFNHIVDFVIMMPLQRLRLFNFKKLVVTTFKGGGVSRSLEVPKS